jgi:4-hydroxy-tetrahydrodipicolinate synthase
MLTAGPLMTGTPELRGVVGACLTPFTEDGSVNGRALERELHFLAGHCDAVSVLGAEVSEYRMLSDAERRRWLREGVAAVAGRVPVVAGASSPRMGEVLELAECAAAAGADFIQVLMPRRPWGPEASTGELLAYYERVAEASPLPVVAYHNPGYGSDPPWDAFPRLAEIDRVVAFKESSRDLSKIVRMVEAVDRAGKAAYLTTMQPLLATLLQGGSGAMMPGPATLIGAEVVAAHRAGDLHRAAAAQRRFAEFPGRWRQYGLAPVMKCALGHLGIDVGARTDPFVGVSEQDSKDIADCVRAFPASS